MSGSASLRILLGAQIEPDHRLDRCEIGLAVSHVTTRPFLPPAGLADGMAEAVVAIVLRSVPFQLTVNRAWMSPELQRDPRHLDIHPPHQGYHGGYLRRNVIGALNPSIGQLVSLIVPHCDTEDHIEPVYSPDFKPIGRLW